MSTITRVSRGELTADEILDILEAGGRVVIEVSVLGTQTTVVVRRHRGTYYCDTPIKLMTHDTREEFRECLVTFRLARPDPVREDEPEGVPA